MVDDDSEVCRYLADFLERRGYRVATAQDGASALSLLRAGVRPDAVLLDVRMPGMDGLATLRRLRALHERLPVIMMSAVDEASTIVEAIQLGSFDYLRKPFDGEELEFTLRNALEKRDLVDERIELQSKLDVDAPGVIWGSAAMREVRQLIERIADTDLTVLIQGETGVGKEVVARAIHDGSSRAGRPFVKVHCAALPSQLLESELFGYEKGAFTGAWGRKAGRFEVAHGGTILLDEIGEMSTELQAKLLQVLQDGEFTRIGGNREVRVDARVICATNRPLEQMVEQGTFRRDLFFRIHVVNLQIPPLRHRRDEIPALFEAFQRHYSAKYAKPVPQESTRFLKLLERYSFPGNVRELENMAKRIVVLQSERSVLREVLGGGEPPAAQALNSLSSLLREVEETAGDVPLLEVRRRAALEIERELIERVLFATDWNRKKAARILRVSYSTLLQKIRACGLEEREGPAASAAGA